MKVSTSFDARTETTFNYSEHLLREVGGGSATQAAAARRIAQTARTQASSSVMKPAAVKAVSTGHSSKPGPPKPIPMSSCYRSCLPTPQGSVQVLHDAEASFYEPTEAGEEPAGGCGTGSFYRASSPQQAAPRGLGLSRGSGMQDTSWHDQEACSPGRSPMASRGHPGGSAYAPAAHLSSPCRGSAREGGGGPTERELAAAALASFGPRSVQASSAPSRELREATRSARDHEQELEEPPLRASNGIRMGRTSVTRGMEEFKTDFRNPPRTPSTTSTNRFMDRSFEGPKVRTRSIDVGSRASASSSTSKGPVGSSTDRVTLNRRGAAASQRQAAIFEDDCSEYSDRFLPGYDKGQLLGRGACAVVWLAVPTGSKTSVAVKQVAKGSTGKKRSDTEAARKEILFGSHFFHAGGEPKMSPKQNPGISHIAKLLEYVETKRDIWLVMEYGGTSLTKMAYEIKGEFHRGERLYRVNHLPLLESMKGNPSVLKAVLRQLISALMLFSEHRIVHSDIKPDNILVEHDDRGQVRVRFIDLGSAFSFDSPESLSLATPEYMPHEGLEVCAAGRNLLSGPSSGSDRYSGLGSTGGRFSLGARLAGQGGVSNNQRSPAAATTTASDPAQRLHRQSQPWSFDVWSLGAILLELSLGTPLWLSYKCRVASDTRVNSAGVGLFAVPGRDPEKIMQRQADALRHRGLATVLRNTPGVPLGDGNACTGLDLLSQMMAWEPQERISPAEALRHPWLFKD